MKRDAADPERPPGGVTAATAARGHLMPVPEDRTMAEPNHGEAVPRPSRVLERTPGEDRGSGWAGPVAVVVAGLLVVVRCLGPVFLAGGLPGGLTGWMARLDPLWIVAAAISGAAGPGFWLRHRTASARKCCNMGAKE